ncbi:MAG: hypothetical protein CFE46_15620 [Burkholderiales bacterium PBB6]|nr:MAG: hypothetical protein CFE46_15620 [Burkholderiales bacterium PBB6]
MSESVAAEPVRVSPSRGRRAAKWLLGTLALIVGLLWLVAPPLVRKALSSELSAFSGRTVTVGSVNIHPWSLTAQLNDVEVAAATAGQPPTLQWASLSVSANWRSIVRAAPIMDAVQLAGLKLRLVRTADGHYDIDDVIKRVQDASASTKSDPKTPPPRFALYNVEVDNANIEFVDEPVKRTHVVSDIRVGLPFMANLDDADVKVKVQPQLNFVLDGTAVNTSASAAPFAPGEPGELRLKTGQIDLAQWLPYLPAGLPVRPTAGQLAVDLTLGFALPPGGAPRAGLKGDVSVAQPALVGAGGQPLADWRLLQVHLDDLQVFRRELALGRVSLDGPRLTLDRLANGRFAGLPVASSESKPAASPRALKDAPAAPDEAAWKLSLREFQLRDGEVAWRDATTRPGAALLSSGLSLDVANLSWPLKPDSAAATLALAGQLSALDGKVKNALATTQVKPPAKPPVKITAATALTTEKAAPAPATSATFQLSAKASVDGGEAQLQAERWALSLFRPYLQQVVQARLDGDVSLDVQANWKGLPGAELPEVLARTVSVDQLRAGSWPAATAPTPPEVTWRSLSVKDARIDLARRVVSLQEVNWQQPALRLVRDAAGQLNLTQWVLPAPDKAATADASPSPPAAQAPSGGPAWQVRLNQARVAGGKLAWQDTLPGADAPVALELEALQLSLDGVQWPAAPQSLVGLSLDAKLGQSGQPRSGWGAVSVKGRAGLLPLSFQGKTRLDRLPLAPLAVYAGDAMPVALLRGALGWQGDVRWQQAADGMRLTVQGDARLADLDVHGRQGKVVHSEPLLSWNSLALPGLSVVMTPGSRPSIKLGEVVLDHLYASLLVTEQGQLNLRDLAAPAAPPAAASADASASAVAVAIPVTSPAASAASTTAIAPSNDLPVEIDIAGVRLIDSRIDFTDRFIRPNYSADIRALSGTLGAFLSGSGELANLALKGKVAGTGGLDIQGTLNPTARPLALDVKAKATDLELAPLSPYAGKYAGYAIERGKLTMALAYRIQPDGQLTASNQIILNQLTFGERIDSPDATRLPVQLAVALLKDRNGVIDLNLPIGGSVNDPQFSVGSLVVKVLVNLLGKAITSPFALLSGGQGEDLSVVAFEPGAVRLSDSAKAVIGRVGEALADRPALKLTITGAVDADQERQAIQEAWLEDRLLALQRKEAAGAGQAAGAPLPALSTAQRLTLVKRLYADTPMPDKPRNVVGLLKDLPLEDMTARLKASHVVNSDVARELALQRGIAVRDAVIALGLPNERVFLAAPRLRPAGDTEPGWTPRAQLGLGTQ